MTLQQQCEDRIRNLIGEKEIYGALPKRLHLEDVLLAVGRGKGVFTSIRTGGKLAMYQLSKPVRYYDLSKPFSSQSQEFYQFLWEIIKK